MTNGSGFLGARAKKIVQPVGKRFGTVGVEHRTQPCVSKHDLDTIDQRFDIVEGLSACGSRNFMYAVG